VGYGYDRRRKKRFSEINFLQMKGGSDPNERGKGRSAYNLPDSDTTIPLQTGEDDSKRELYSA